MRTLRAGIIGTGYIGPAHIEGLRRLNTVDVKAVAEANQELADAKARLLGIPDAYGDYHDMLKDDSIDVVHNCTPNFMHVQVNKDILNAGKHCISEKPLGMNSEESAELVALAKNKGLVNAVNFNYRYYPLVQQMRIMVQNGELGNVFAVQGCYMQDWLLYDTDWSWRLDPKMAGESRVMGDIGSHWFDLIQFVTGKNIVQVLADLLTLHEYRKKPKGEVETFSGKELKPTDYETVKIDSEGYGNVLMRFDDGSKGMTCISQVSSGRKNHIVFELNGTKKSIWWDHERPNELMIGNRNEPNQMMLKDAVLMDDMVKEYAHYPAGHNEGYPTAVKNFCRNVYRHIGDRSRKIDFATFADGHNADCIVEAVLKSHKTDNWVRVE